MKRVTDAGVRQVGACCRSMRVLVFMLLVACVGLPPRANAAAYAWCEGETPQSSTGKAVTDAPGHKTFLSGAAWLALSIDAAKVDKELPAEGAQISYKFAVAAGGEHEIWARLGYEFARSPFDWRVDQGAWATVKSDTLTTDLVELCTWNEVAWLKLATQPLTAGDHTLTFRLAPQHDAKGQAVRTLFALDAVCVYPGAFRPNGKFKPDEEWRTEQDLQAAKQQFELPAAANGAERAVVELKGLWEVCRHDEALPGPDVAQPIKELPERPLWSAIAVPGDKKVVRPDLTFCHRLWYRAKVNVPAAAAGHAFFLDFPENNLNTTVYVNGTYCGFNKTPLARFQIDVTAGIKPGGVNEIWVGIRDAWYGFATSPTNPMRLRGLFNYPSEWGNKGFMHLAYPIWNHFQSGILLAPSLVMAGGVYAADVFPMPSVAKKQLAAEIVVCNTGSADASGELRLEAVRVRSGAVEKTFAPVAFNVKAGAERVLRPAEGWANPALWWPDEPNLYDLRTTLTVGGRPVDVRLTRFGFREWQWAGKDFKLNGIPWHGWADCFTKPTPDEWLAFYRQNNQTMMRFWGTRWLGLAPEAALDFMDANGVVVRRSGILDGETIGYMAIETDPELQKESPIKMDLMRNWRDQAVARARAERNHPSVFIWSIENEWLFINCLNLYGQHMPLFEAEVTRTAEAVQAADPTRPVMVDGGGATQAQTLPVHGDHYVSDKPQKYPDLAYEDNPKGGGRGRWEWDLKRPRFLGEDFFMTGTHPEVAYFQGESAFSGKPRRGTAIWNRILQEGYRWAGYGAWQFWLGQEDADQSQYLAYAPRAVFARNWDWSLASGQRVTRRFRVFNDTRYSDPLTFTWLLTVPGCKPATESIQCAVSPGGTMTIDSTLPVPVVQERQEGELRLTLTVKGREVFRDVKAVSVLNPALAGGGTRLPGVDARSLGVLDPQGGTATFLREFGLACTPVASLEALPPEIRVLVVGKDALTAGDSSSSALASLAAAGRRVIVLEQANPLRYQGLPADMEAATNQGFTAFIEDAGHPVLRGLQDKDFFTWGPGRPVYRNAYFKPTRGARSLVQCDEVLKNTGLAELAVGPGLMLLCQLTVAENLPNQAAARQLLLNLVSYAAAYVIETAPTVAVVSDAPQLQRALDAVGLSYAKAGDPLQALADKATRVAILNASPATLKVLAANQARVDAFTAAGGTLILCGLTPEGLVDYNTLVGFQHMIRPFKRERVTLPPVRDRLTAGLTGGDVVLLSAQKIFPWTEGRYVVSDLFSYVVDYDEVAPFGKSTFASYDNIVNNFGSADGWPLIINFPKNAEDSPFDVPITFPQPQTFTEFTWVGNLFYWPQTKVNLIFDGDQAGALSFDTAPNTEPQNFELKPPRAASRVTVQIAGWEPQPDKKPLIGIDNIYLRAARPPEFLKNVKPLVNIGGLMRYAKGPGNIVLCNVLFKDTEEVPENVEKRRRILACLLHNLKAPFAAGKTVIAGEGLQYTPVPLDKFGTQYRGDQGWFGDKQHTFKDLPIGSQKFAGVRYDIFELATSPVPNAIMLAGRDVPGKLPEAVTGIAVGRKADALFFLHTARLDQKMNERDIREKKRFELLRYVVHYADGQTTEIPVYAEIDIHEYLQKTPQAIPGAQLAWTRPYDDGTFAVAYSMQWSNPRPDAEIKALDIRYGKDRRGVPVVLAITAASAR